MKNNPKTEGTNIQRQVKGMTNNQPSVNVTSENEVVNDAVNSWQSQNLINHIEPDEEDTKQDPDSLVTGDIPNRVRELLASSNSGAINQNQPSVDFGSNSQVNPVNSIVDTFNPYMPVLQIRTLPSKFKPYKLLVTKPEIYYKPYKFGEIKKMNQSRMSLKQLFKEVLLGIECNFDKELLTVADFSYIGLMRRVSTLKSARFNASFVCQACGGTNKQDFDHTKLDFQDLECDLPICVDFNGKEYTFTPLTIKDYFILYELDKLEDEIAFLAIQCRNNDIVINYPVKDEKGVKLTDEQRRFFTIYDILYNLTSADDAEVLDLLDTYLNHKLKPVQLSCTNIISYDDEEGNKKEEACATPINVALDGGGVLITPFRESEEPLKSRIRFGFKANS